MGDEIEYTGLIFFKSIPSDSPYPPRDTSFHEIVFDPFNPSFTPGIVEFSIQFMMLVSQ